MNKIESLIKGLEILQKYTDEMQPSELPGDTPVYIYLAETTSQKISEEDSKVLNNLPYWHNATGRYGLECWEFSL